MTQNIRFWVSIAILLLLSGCTIVHGKMQNKKTVERMEAKERELKELQSGIQTNEEINNRLLSQLQGELQELEQLINANRVIDDANMQKREELAKQKKRLADLNNRLGQLKKELVHGSGGRDEKSLADKKRQIEKLRRDIETYVRMGNN